MGISDFSASDPRPLLEMQVRVTMRLLPMDANDSSESLFALHQERVRIGDDPDKPSIVARFGRVDQIALLQLESEPGCTA